MIMRMAATSHTLLSGVCGSPPSLTLPHKGGGNGNSALLLRKGSGPCRNFSPGDTHELNPPASVGTSSGLKP